ncbi:MAG: EamA family transporter [Nocardioides sp.]
MSVMSREVAIVPIGVSETGPLAAASGSVYYGLAFWFFISGLRGVPASIAGAFLPLIPVFGLGAAYLVGDLLLDRQWLGATLVVLATLGADLHYLTDKIPVTAIFRDTAEADRVFGCQRATARAVQAGYLSDAAGATWLDHLRTERLFASVTLFVTLAMRPK